jgi:DNA-binding CsgD family transcriptional regulator
MKEGISLYKEAIHPADDLMLWDLTRKAWELLLATPAPKRFACGYNRAYRLRKAGGTYRWLLEHNQVLQADRRGNITHLLGTCTDITPIREDSPVRVSLVHEQSGMLVDMAIEQQEREKSLFSKRELEILAMVVAGQTSSQIASHLHLSYHTVNKHRSKMHRKIRSRSTAELVQFAMRHRLVTIQ